MKKMKNKEASASEKISSEEVEAADKVVARRTKSSAELTKHIETKRNQTEALPLADPSEGPHAAVANTSTGSTGGVECATTSATEMGLILCLNSSGSLGVLEVVDEGPDDQSPLSDDERKLFDDCKGRIDRGLKEFEDVYDALMTIKFKKLYREQFRTFEKFCSANYNISRVHLDRQLRALETVAELKDTGCEIPKNEAQARELGDLAKDDKIKVMQKAKAAAGDKSVTAKLIKKAKREVVGGGDADVEVKPRAAKAAKDEDKPAVDLLKGILLQIHKAQAFLDAEEYDNAAMVLEEIEETLSARCDPNAKEGANEED